MMAISQMSWTLLGLLFVSGLTSSLNWSGDLQDGQTVYACTGGSLLLPWNVSESVVEEGIEDIQWFFHGRSQEMVAMFARGNFLPTAPFAHRVEHVGMGGLLMQHVQLSDAGNYTIVVSGRDASGSFFSQRKTAMAEVIDGLKTTDGQLHISEEEKAVWDDSDKEFHVALSCGTFTNVTYLPFEVEWTLPDGQVKNSTRFVNGSFQLLLANPIRGGNYSCRIPHLASAAACLPDDLSKPFQADIYVDSVEGRMSVLETQQRVLQTENDRLSRKVEELTAADVTLQTENDRLSGHVEELTAELQSFINTTESQHVSFHVRLSQDLTTRGHSPIIMTDVQNNEGGAYDTLTGVFTAPVNGTYFFAGTVKSIRTFSAGYQSMARIDFEGNMLCSLASLIEDEIASCQAIVSLSSGQRVWMRSWGSTSDYYYFNNFITAFTGFLISPGV